MRMSIRPLCTWEVLQAIIMSGCFHDGLYIYNSKRRQFAPFYKRLDGAAKVGGLGLVVAEIFLAH